MQNRYQVSSEPALGRVQGYVTTSYAKLRSLFGEPSESDGYKVSSEWSIKDTQTGISFSLYDYKQTALYDRGYPTVDEFREQHSYEWHIGGQGNVTADVIRQFQEWVDAQPEPSEPASYTRPEPMTPKAYIRQLIVQTGHVSKENVNAYMQACVSPVTAAERLAVQLFIQGKTDDRLRRMFEYLQDNGRLPEYV